jgi:hypothetical protein
LRADERKRLVDAVRIGFTIPLIDDVEDFIWEAIFSYVKGTSLSQSRNKRLFDVVDTEGTGWSLKTLVWNRMRPGDSFEFVIQRADIFKKAEALGFKRGLRQDSDTADLGAALIRHWNMKYEADREHQGVHEARIALLLKDTRRSAFAYVEYAYPPLRERDFTWRWSKEGGYGLQGFERGSLRLKWYYGQKQLFQVFEVPADVFTFRLEWQRPDLDGFFEKMHDLFRPR